MSQGKGLTGLAAVAAAAALACFGMQSARAADTAAPSSELTLNQPVATQMMDGAGTFTPWTAQGALAGTSAGDALDKAKVTFSGFAEGSYTYNFTRTPGRANFDRVFDVEREHLDLDQLDIQVARNVDFSSSAWDVGGLIELQYGEDARFLHSNGLNFYGNANPQPSPKDQFDLTQAYVVVNAPLGNGLKITAGKFVTLLGYEVINPTGNALFSHSYLFGYAIPFTNTGITGTYKFNDTVTATAGITRGWDQALKDNNGAIDAIGQVVITTASVKGLTLYVNGISGPEATNDNSHYRSVIDATAVYAYGDNWTFAVNGDFGWEDKAGIGGKDAKWFGGAAYATYKYDSHVSITGRGEYFSDHDGARGIGGEVYEVTVGPEITPMPDNKYLAGLMIRPEFRWDFSGDKLFDAGQKQWQTTVAADVIYKF